MSTQTEHTYHLRWLPPGARQITTIRTFNATLEDAAKVCPVLLGLDLGGTLSLQRVTHHVHYDVLVTNLKAHCQQVLKDYEKEPPAAYIAAVQDLAETADLLRSHNYAELAKGDLFNLLPTGLAQEIHDHEREEGVDHLLQITNGNTHGNAFVTLGELEF
jgi:hypothetical protein